MAYEINQNKGGSKAGRISQTRLGTSQGNNANAHKSKFYELELAEVIDIIYDDEHEDFPKDDKDYSYIGACKVRLIHSQYNAPDDMCGWVRPLDSQIKQYPVKGEYIVVVEYIGDLYYTQNLNLLGSANNNSLPFLSVSKKIVSDGKKADYDQISVTGKPKPASDLGDDYKLGDEFKNDDLVRNLQHYEGDISFNGRFGQSIRFGSNKQTTFLNDDIEVKEDSPNILMRVGNMDREDIQPDPKNKPIDEDINKDGTSLWLVSDQEVKLEPATTEGKQHNKAPKRLGDKGSYKDEKMGQVKNKLGIKVDFDNDSKYEGKQIFLNTDRIVFNTKDKGDYGSGQFICYSKSWQYFDTDDRFMVDSGKGTTLETQGDTEIVSKQLISLKTDELTVIDSPKIFLGKSAKEPVVLGDTLLGLLKELCSAYQSHIHPTPAGPSGPPVNAGVVAGISARWKTFLSPQNKTL